jgi:hypothetical protein
MSIFYWQKVRNGYISCLEHFMRPLCSRESPIPVISQKTNPVRATLLRAAKATYGQTVARSPAVLSNGKLRYNAYHRTPVFFLLLTGAAKENFAMERSPRGRD